MAHVMSVAMNKNLYEEVETKAKAQGVSKCAYLRYLLESDVKNKQKVIKKDERIRLVA